MICWMCVNRVSPNGGRFGIWGLGFGENDFCNGSPSQELSDSEMQYVVFFFLEIIFVGILMAAW